MGVKQSLLVEERGGPLCVCIAGANVNDHLLLAATLDAIVVERPALTEEAPQHLCLDKGYDNEPSQSVLTERNSQAHIRCIGKEKKDEQGEKTHPARRWAVERTFSWLSLAGPVAPLGEKARELSDNYEDGLRFALIPTSPSSRLMTFGIDC